MSDVRALHEIQKLELGIIQDTKRIKAINAELENDGALQESEELFNVAKAEFDDTSKRAKDMEREITAVVDKRNSAETRLYSGEVKSPKALQDMQMEIEVLGRRKASLDNELRDITIERERRQKRLEEREDQLNDLRQKQEADNQELLTEKTSLTETVNERLAQRRKAVRAIPADLYKIYNHLRTAKSNRPLAVLKDDACTICGIVQNNTVITAINRNERLVKCQNCGRILIRL